MNHDTSHLSAQNIELPEFPESQGSGQSILTNTLSAIEHVRVKLSVQVGEVSLTIAELSNLKEEQTLTLESLADAPVDILLEGKIVARGLLVAVEDNFGVCITELPKN